MPTQKENSEEGWIINGLVACFGIGSCLNWYADLLAARTGCCSSRQWLESRDYRLLVISNFLSRACSPSASAALSLPRIWCGISALPRISVDSGNRYHDRLSLSWRRLRKRWFSLWYCPGQPGNWSDVAVLAVLAYCKSPWLAGRFNSWNDQADIRVYPVGKVRIGAGLLEPPSARLKRKSRKENNRLDR